MKEAILIASAFCAFAFLFVPSKLANGWPATLVKTASVAGLALIATLGGYSTLAIALAFCAAGDWALSRPGQRAFLIGMVAFGAGHLSYIALIMSYNASGWVGPSIVVAAGLVGVSVAMVIRLWHVTGALRWPVMIYIAILLTMGLFALQGGLFIWPALLFIASDIMVAFQRFITPQDSPRRALQSVGIWALYWVSQVGFLFLVIAVNAF